MSLTFLLTALVIVVTPGTGALFIIAAGMSRGARDLAWSTWRDKTVLSVAADATPRAAGKVIRSAVLINLLNPKLTIFFFAFLPQFAPRNSPHALARLLGLSAVFMLMTLVVFSLYGVFAAAVRTHLLERPRIVDRLRRLFAVSFVALGAKLATTARS